MRYHLDKVIVGGALPPAPTNSCQAGWRGASLTRRSYTVRFRGQLPIIAIELTMSGDALGVTSSDSQGLYACRSSLFKPL